MGGRNQTLYWGYGQIGGGFEERKKLDSIKRGGWEKWERGGWRGKTVTWWGGFRKRRRGKKRGSKKSK